MDGPRKEIILSVVIQTWKDKHDMYGELWLVCKKNKKKKEIRFVFPLPLCSPPPISPKCFSHSSPIYCILNSYFPVARLCSKEKQMNDGKEE